MTYRPTQKNIFSTPGTYTWTCPPDVSAIDLTLIGGGGGGGGGGAGGAGAPIFNTGGGAGGASGSAGTSGEFVKMKSVIVTPGVTYSIQVGAGGTYGGGGGTSGANGAGGESGEPSTFTFPNGLILRADAGLGGYYGNGGGSGSGSTSAGFTQNVEEINGQAFGIPWDGSSIGEAGNTPSVHNTALASGWSGNQIYQIYTDEGNLLNASTGDAIAEVIYPNDGVYGPFGRLPTGMITGNTCLNVVTTGSGLSSYDGSTTFQTSSSNAYSISGINSGASCGGAGGVLRLFYLIPIYFIYIDFNSFTLPIKLPWINSINGSGLGNGSNGVNAYWTYNGATPSAGPNPLTNPIGFWSDGNATIIGYGAGGLGGPGGGGGGAGGLYGGGAAQGGAGYHGDQGLGGVVVISW